MSPSAAWSDSFTFLPQGAVIQKFKVGGQNIVLGFDDPADYNADFNPYFGETVGRVANRIASARIDNLNGRSYTLNANNGRNTNHGGAVSWGKRLFDGPHFVRRRERDAVLFTYLSKDGEEGFPGAVELKVWYVPSVTENRSSLEIEYEVSLVDGHVEETVVNVCNHSYFNLSGLPTIEGTTARLCTNLHQVKSPEDLPSGAIEPFPGIKANEDFTLGKQDPDIDHCFIVSTKPSSIPVDTRSEELRLLGSFYHPATKIHLEVHSTEPAFQFYTGAFIDVPNRGKTPAFVPRSGFCVEAGRYVNAINNDEWRAMVVLRKGQPYGSRTIYTASLA